jgi:hypothetical protein
MCQGYFWGLAYLSCTEGDTQKGLAHRAEGWFLPVPSYGLREAHSPNSIQGEFSEVRQKTSESG